MYRPAMDPGPRPLLLAGDQRTGPRRSEALALAQLLIVSHLVGALDGAFEL